MDLTIHFSRKYIQMIQRYVKKCSVLLAFREMQIHTTVRYLFIHVRMTVRKEKSVDQVLILLVVIQNNVVAIENNVRFLKKLKGELSDRTSNPTSGYIYPEKLKSESPQNISTPISTPMFVAPLFTVAKRWKPSLCPQISGQRKCCICI